MSKPGRHIKKAGRDPKWALPTVFGPKVSRQRIRGQVVNVKR